MQAGQGYVSGLKLKESIWSCFGKKYDSLSRAATTTNYFQLSILFDLLIIFQLIIFSITRLGVCSHASSSERLELGTVEL